MYCTKCGSELRDDANFCSQCGTRTAVAPPPTQPRELMLDKRHKKIAGVCAGFARYLDLDVTVIRVVWLGLALCTGGMGFLAYLAAWIIVPSDCGIDARNVIVQQPQVIR